MVASPGYANQSTIRTVFRTAGITFTATGVFLVGYGIYSLVTQIDDMEGPGSGAFMFGGGALLVVLGFGLLNAGFSGAAARYAAGETMPVVKDSLEYIKSEKTGPFCSKCGVRNGTGARFCDACGTALA
jgi:hypothetical protein